MEQPETDLREGWELLDVPSVPRTAEALPPVRTGVQWSDAIKFWVNGEEVIIKNPSPSVTLLEWMLETRGLTGTHLGCGEGGCGICTVVLVDPVWEDGANQQLLASPVRCGRPHCEHAGTGQCTGGLAPDFRRRSPTEIVRSAASVRLDGS